MARTKRPLTVVGHLADADVEDAAERPERSGDLPTDGRLGRRIERRQLYGAAILRSTVGSLIAADALGDGTAVALGDGGGEAVGATVGAGSAPSWDSGLAMRRVSRRRR